MAIDINSVNDEIRVITGVTTETMSDTDLNNIIQRNINKYGSEDQYLCQVTYYSILDMLKRLMVTTASSAAGSTAGGGAIKKRREEEGNVEIEIEYDTSTGAVSGTSWKDVYEMFVEDPSLVCDELVSVGVPSSGTPIINSSKDRYGVKAPYRRTPYNQSFPFRRK